MIKYFVILATWVSFPVFGDKLGYTVGRKIKSPLANNIQGITHNNKHWFISNIDHIYKFPISIKFNKETFNQTNLTRFQHVTLPKHLVKLGYHHFGGITMYKGYLVVALERIKPMKLLFYDSDTFELKKQYDVPFELDSLSWVASDDQFIYFSENRINIKKPLYKLELDSNTLQKLQLSGISSIKKIQGGTIDKRQGILYLASDNGRRNGGLYKINLSSYKASKILGICYTPYFPIYEEIEGLTIKPYKNGSKTEIYMLLLNNNLRKDTFKIIDIKNLNYY